MNLTTPLDRIFKAQQQREESRARNYRSLVAEIAGGTEPQADRLNQILTASGKSVEQLRADVELHQQCRAWREQYDALPKLNEETATIERQIADAEKAFEAARAQFHAATNPLHARLRQVPEERKQAEAAKGRLQKTCPHVELVVELQHVRDEHREAHNRHIKLDLGIKGRARQRSPIVPRPNTPAEIHARENTSNGPSGLTPSASRWNPSCRLPRSRSRRWSSGRRRSWSGC